MLEILNFVWRELLIWRRRDSAVWKSFPLGFKCVGRLDRLLSNLEGDVMAFWREGPVLCLAVVKWLV